MKNNIQNIQFTCWLELGTGTPREHVMNWAAGENWKELTFKETAQILKNKHNIDILNMSIQTGLKILIQKWEENTNQNFQELRNKFFSEEYNLLDKPYI